MDEEQKMQVQQMSWAFLLGVAGVELQGAGFSEESIHAFIDASLRGESPHLREDVDKQHPWEFLVGVAVHQLAVMGLPAENMHQIIGEKFRGPQ